MSEEFLYYLWGFRILDSNLQTTSGESLIIIHPGERNKDGGPDFLNARIRIADTLWAGNVEIHVNAGDWFRHNHHHDKAYENVILHVVFSDDGYPETINPLSIPTLVVEGRFPTNIFSRYNYFLENPSWIPCQQLIREAEFFYIEQWSASLVIERLVDRSHLWREMLESNGYDWEETFYQCISKAFGLKINTLPFELLAKSLSLKIVLKHVTNPFQLEALAFGQSGMLTKIFKEEYPLLLKKEYEFLAEKYGLKPIEPSLWKFLRLRPSAFPTVRLAQWAMFMQQINTLFNLILQCVSIDEIRKILTVQASDYWNQHYVFDKLSPLRSKILGITTIDLLILNFVLPFLFFYGDEKALPSFKEHSLTLLEQIPGEVNSVIEQWKLLGLPVDNALQTQALIQLKTNYCDRKKCLSCRIGIQLLAREVVG